MRAPRDMVDTRRIAAALAAGVVVSMTAMAAGVAPALAAPGNGPGTPATTVAPEPAAKAPAQQPAEREAPAQQAPAPQAPAQQAPAPEAPAPQAPAVQAPVSQAPVSQAPAVQAPVREAPVEAPAQPKPQTRAPQPEPAAPATAPVKPPTTAATSTAPAPSREATPSSDAARPTTQPPVTSASPSASPAQKTPEQTASEPARTPASAPAATPADPRLAPSGTVTPESVVPQPDPAATDAARPSEPSTGPSTGAESTSAESRPARPSEPTATSSVSQAARAIQTSEPETLQAPAEDVQIAKTAKVVELPKPEPAPQADVDAIAKLIDLPNVPRDLPGVDGARDAARVDRRDDRARNDDIRLAGAWDRNVRQWSPDWVSYDDYYRPVLSNPYRDPVRIVYVYENRPRIAYIPPLSRIVLEVAQYAAYSFTAVVQNAVSAVVNTAIDTAVNVAVGSFFGGGFFPGIGLPLPPPPPPVLRYDNVPVFVNYSQAQYEPFRVQRIVDVGDDPQFGERKVLLDGVTPAWGQWNQSPSGERQFEVHRTQQFPGLDQPSEAPLPGDYQLRLLSDESKSSGLNRRDVYLLSAAGLCAVLSIGAVLVAMAMGRRRRI